MIFRWNQLFMMSSITQNMLSCRTFVKKGQSIIGAPIIDCFLPPDVYDEPIKLLHIWSSFWKNYRTHPRYFTMRWSDDCPRLSSELTSTVRENSHSTKSNNSSVLIIVRQNILKIWDPGLSIDMMRKPSQYTLSHSGSVSTLVSVIKKITLYSYKIILRFLRKKGPVIWSLSTHWGSKEKLMYTILVFRGKSSPGMGCMVLMA